MASSRRVALFQVKGLSLHLASSRRVALFQVKGLSLQFRVERVEDFEFSV